MKQDAMKPVTVSLSPQQVARLGAAVASGAYASNSEIIGEALLLWEQREDLRLLDVADLRIAYEAGIASGEPVEGDAAFARIRSHLFGALEG
jgi:antitoxin ParD1/3/4